MILALLIRGHSSDYVCEFMDITKVAFGMRMDSMRTVVGAESSYQLIAMEVAAQIEVSDPEAVKALFTRCAKCEGRMVKAAGVGG
jgi:hypothetical protein